MSITWFYSEGYAKKLGSDKGGGIEKEFIISSKDTAVCGLAFKVDGDNLAKFAYKAIDLNTKESRWVDVDGEGFSQDEYEKVYEFEDEAMVLTGFCLKSGRWTMMDSKIYGQRVDESQIHCLHPMVEGFGDGSDAEVEYQPSYTNTGIIVGLGLRVRGGNIVTCEVKVARLLKEGQDLPEGAVEE